MFEREVKFIYDFSTNKVKKLGAYISFPELKEVGIHPAILRYIAAEIEYKVFEDRQNLLTRSIFDYSTDTISKYFALITEEIKREKKFSAEFINKSILHASSFNVNYLIRPNWALKKLIFDSEKSKSAAEIKQILNYAYYYDFIVKVIKDYINKKKLISLDVDDFDDLLKRIDKVSIDSNLDNILDQVIEAMSSFFNIGSFNRNSIPLQGMGVFLKEKELTEQINLIQKALGDEAKPRISKNDLKEILFGSGIEKTEYYEVTQDEQDEQDEIAIEEASDVEEEENEDDVFSEELKSESVNEDIAPEEIVVQENVDDEELPAEAEDVAEGEDVKEIDEEDSDVIDVNVEEDLSDESEEVPVQEDETVEETAEWREEAIENIVETGEVLPEELEKEEEIGIKLRENKEKEVDEIVPPIEEEIEQEEFPGEIFKDDDEPDTVNENELEEVSEEDTEEEGEIETSAAEDEDSVDEEVIVEGEIQQFPEEENEYNENYNLEEAVQEDEVEPVQAEEIEDTREDNAVQEDESLLTGSEEDVNTGMDDVQTGDEELIKNDDKDEEEPSLFQDEADDEEEESIDSGLSIDEIEEEEFIKGYGSQTRNNKIDISDLLEKKDITKIIQVVFDYDMEDFANTIEQICDSSDKDEAFSKLDDVFDLNQVNPSSKEAQAFREIIAEYFDQN